MLMHPGSSVAVKIKVIDAASMLASAPEILSARDAGITHNASDISVRDAAIT